MLIWGREDKIIPLACHKTFQDKIKGSKLVVLPETSHSLHTERAKECDEAIASFVKEHGK